MPRRARTLAELRALAEKPWKRLSKTQQRELRSWRTRSAAQRKGKRSKEELRELAERPWSRLSEAQRRDLRSWRAERAAKSREAGQFDYLVDLLNSGSENRVRARAELRRVGTGVFARWLKKHRRWDKRDIKETFAFWFY